MLSVTYKPLKLSVVMLNVVMLNVDMLNVIMLSVLAPVFYHTPAFPLPKQDLQVVFSVVVLAKN